MASKENEQPDKIAQTNCACSGFEDIKLFCMLNSTEREIPTANGSKNAEKILLAFKLSDVVIIWLTNVQILIICIYQAYKCSNTYNCLVFKYQ